MCSDGRNRFVEMSVSVIEDHGEQSILSVLRDVTDLRVANIAVTQAHSELRRMLDVQDRVQDEERSRIARELHDDLQQTLAAIKIDLYVGTTISGSDSADLGAIISRVGGLAEDAIESVRRIVTDLRPRTLDELGLVPALERLHREFSRRTGIAVALTTGAEVARSLAGHPGVATCVFRVVQEALNNVAKHSRSGSAQVGIVIDAGGRCLLTISDAGKGFTLSQAASPESFGLRGMRERVQAIGGSLRIASVPGVGTKVSASLPLVDPARTGELQCDDDDLGAFRPFAGHEESSPDAALVGGP